MYYVYILQSKARFYIGSTNDLKRRVGEHNKGQNIATKSHVPWDLIFYEAYVDKEDCLRREKYLKTTQGRQAVRRMIKSYLGKQRIYYQ